MWIKTIVIGIASFVATAASTSAGVIYTTGPVDFSNGANYYSQDNYEQLTAVTFNLAAAHMIRSVDFWGAHLESGDIPSDDNFRVVVFGNNAGLPDSGNVIGTSSLSLVSRTSTGHNFVYSPNAEIQAYEMNLASPILIPDSNTYWLGVQSLTSSNDTLFGWAQTAPGGTQAVQDYFAGWFPAANRSAFNLYDESRLASAAAVPEPASIVLMGFGAGIFVIGRVFRRRTKKLAEKTASE